MEYNKTWEEFFSDELNEPGTIIETESGSEYLIGDINTTGGICDCCTGINKNTIIVNYRKILEV